MEILGKKLLLFLKVCACGSIIAIKYTLFNDLFCITSIHLSLSSAEM